MLEHLAQQGIVDSELAFKIEELQALRNIAMVDEGELSAENYERYAMQANRVWRELVNARRNLLPLEK
jgi:uncharacterized protein YutE (UPF0331/DUF86 family)